MTVDGQAAKVLTAYVDLVVERGIRGATLESVAGRTGLSKSGVLHHFGSMSLMRASLFTELRAQARRDVEVMSRADEGAVRYYLVSSLDRRSELERLVEACTRIAQTGDSIALAVLRECRGGWLGALRKATRDDFLARTILFIGDGLNHNALMSLSSDEEVLTAGYVEALIAKLTGDSHSSTDS